jgi:Na+-transporting NADH:ubiquinone oxidoreductase subunit NqrD
MVSLVESVATAPGSDLVLVAVAPVRDLSIRDANLFGYTVVEAPDRRACLCLAAS